MPIDDKNRFRICSRTKSGRWYFTPGGYPEIAGECQQMFDALCQQSNVAIVRIIEVHQNFEAPKPETSLLRDN